MHFARLLRAAGLPVAPDRVQLALQALPLVDIGLRADFRHSLQACFLARHEQQPLFDEAFEVFWQTAANGKAQPLPFTAQGTTATDSGNQRLAAAVFPERAREANREPPSSRDADLAWSASEALREADFNRMSADEWQEAQRVLRQLRLFFEPLRIRRPRRAARPGAADWRATLQAMARQPEAWPMRWREPRRRPPPIVVLADISASMSRYSRMLLHFAHALGRSDLHVHSFVFGTRLTPITRLMAQRDPDVAVAQVSEHVQDWSGGTRITACLREFNRHWARRVLGGNATVILITDGLEHGDTAALAFEMERLAMACRRVVWLNPLLRYARFEPRAAGIRAMLPHVERFVPAHNLASLAQLARLLADPSHARGAPR